MSAFDLVLLAIIAVAVLVGVGLAKVIHDHTYRPRLSRSERAARDRGDS